VNRGVPRHKANLARWASLAAALAAAGCTLTVTPSDAGSDAASANDGGAQTVGDQCAAIYTELCTQAIARCGIAVMLSDCVNNYVAACCVGSACSQPSQSPASAVSACKSAMDSEGCYDISVGNTPPACQGIPKK
jgi:hypothetical protein